MAPSYGDARWDKYHIDILSARYIVGRHDVIAL
jgi:hypothetical protein